MWVNSDLKQIYYALQDVFIGSPRFVNSDLKQIYDLLQSGGLVANPTIGNPVNDGLPDSVLYVDTFGNLAQSQNELNYNVTSGTFGVGRRTGNTARVTFKGFGLTGATSAGIVLNSNDERIIEFRDDKSVLIGTYAQLSDDGNSFKIKDRFDHSILNIDTNNGRCISMNDNPLGGGSSFAGGGRYSYSRAYGQDSFAFGEYTEASGNQSRAYGIFGKAYFKNQRSIGNEVNAPCGNHKIVFGYSQPPATTTPQNTLIPLKNYDFTPYYGTYTTLLCKIRTIVMASSECQSIEQTFTLDISGGVMSLVGAIVTNYNGGDASMSTGAMTYSFAAKTISIGYTTPTVRANDSYAISTNFEFEMIGS